MVSGDSLRLIHPAKETGSEGGARVKESTYIDIGDDGATSPLMCVFGSVKTNRLFNANKSTRLW